MAYTNSAAFSPRGTVISFEAPGSTYFQALAEIKSISFTGAKYDLADTTNYESGNFREWLTTLADSGEVKFEGNYLPGDPSQSSLLGFFNNGTLVSWNIGLPNSLGNITFKAYVSSLEHNLPLDKEATINVTLKITGTVGGF
jgi:predicted secreted protein